MKRRAVVVLHVRDERAIVVWGTGTVGREVPSITIEPRERTGRILGLTKPTVFYGTNFAVVNVADIEVRGLCRPEKFFELEAAFQEANQRPAESALDPAKG